MIQSRMQIAMLVLRPVLLLASWVLVRVIRGPMSLLRRVYFQREIFTYNLPVFQFVVASSKSAVQHVLPRGGDYPKSVLTRAILSPLIGRGLFARGEPEAAIRRMFVRAIAQVEDRTIVETCERLLQEYRSRWERTSEVQRLPVSAEMSRITVDIVSECLFQTRFNEDESVEFTDLFVQYQHTSSALKLFTVTGRQAIAPLRRRRQKRIAERMRDLMRARFVSALRDPSSTAAASPFALAVTERERAGEKALSDERLLDEVAVMLLAGHETTASVLSWLLRELANDPGLQSRLREELKRSPAGGARARADATLLRSVINEALRLFPPIATFLREAKGPDTIDGVAVRPGAMVMISPWIIQRHELLWDEPDTFKAERFQSLSASDTANRFLPFGLGPRSCPGSRFAMVEMQVLVGGIVQEYGLRLLSGSAARPLGNLTARPDREIYVALEALPLG